jgi:hypothetical protein
MRKRRHRDNRDFNLIYLIVLKIKRLNKNETQVIKEMMNVISSTYLNIAYQLYRAAFMS